MSTTQPVFGATSPDVPPSTGRARQWIVVLTVVWVLVLLVAAVIAARGGTATGRDQTTVAQARPHVDAAAALVASAATTDGQAVVVVSAFEKVRDCDVSVFRGGVRYGRAVIAVVTPGSERALLNRVADRLPSSYDATVRPGSAPRLTADAGYWVTLVGAVLRPGEVRFFVDTGDCRVAGDVVTADPSGPGDRTAVLSVLDRLGVAPSSWSEAAVSCPDGGVTRTVLATAPAFAGALDARLSLDGESSHGQAVVSGPRIYAYHVADTAVAVRAHEDALLVSETSPCR